MNLLEWIALFLALVAVILSVIAYVWYRQALRIKNRRIKDLEDTIAFQVRTHEENIRILKELKKLFPQPFEKYLSSARPAYNSYVYTYLSGREWNREWNLDLITKINAAYEQESKDEEFKSILNELRKYRE